MYTPTVEGSWLLVTTNEDWAARRVRNLYGHARILKSDIAAGEMFLGPDAVPIDGVDAWSSATCFRLPDLQPIAAPSADAETTKSLTAAPGRQAAGCSQMVHRVIIYRQQCFGFFTLLEHMEMTLSGGKARHMGGGRLAKTRTLLQDAPPVDGDPGPTSPPPPDAPAPYV